ncbi:Protein of unknown function DUF639 [Macleaya cordata]|uniref:Uncharacterized protein n=1 Tax=Macleaya cordata TaxID=56857 RepID=A0A200QC26_MACCD|nr:Protein of unknown function DUF639 [Macleaya cordata]
MHFEFSLTTPPNPSPISLIPLRDFGKFGFSPRNNPQEKFRLKLVAQSFGDKWKLNEIDANLLQEKWNLWLLKTQSFLNEVTAPLVKKGSSGKTDVEKALLDTREIEEVFVAEQTIDSRTPNGNLSLAAIVSIEQFSRMNGLTGQKMQKIYETLVPESLRYDARHLVEYCCFRFLSRDSSDFHPSLKEPAFRRLIFITMLAWEYPYSESIGSCADVSEISLKRKLVGEEAFVRIASAVSGVADRSTAHNLFKVLVGDEHGMSLSLWKTYIEELLKVHEGRKSYQSRESFELSTEQILCIGSSRKRPVLKWETNIAWPGKVTLTTNALYFEAIGLKGQKEAIRLDLTGHGSRVEKAKVGPLGTALFDSAVSVSSGSGSKTLVLEFVDFGGEMRRDVWHAFISEVIALHEFIREYGPEDDDESVFHVYGAHRGKMRAITSAINSITRLQALQFIRKLSEDPTKLVQFSYLRNAPYGDVVCQTLAVNFWGGSLVTKFTGADHLQGIGPSDDVSNSSGHVFDIDGSVYLRKWMKSPSWASSTSVAFWKNASVRSGVVLSKHLLVADKTLVERATILCKEKSQVVEKTQATIDAATLKGIPSNIDLFKELMLPLVVIAKNIDKLRRWKEPHLTVSFLAFAYTLIFRNMLSYIFPMTLMVVAAAMLLLIGLKEQGRLGRSFGKVTIRDQPPSNTIQKIIAIKEAMLDLESYLQNLNVTLLKVRTIVLSGQPQITTEVALVLLSSATILLLVPFRFILAFFLMDLFTRELEFRRETVMRFMSFLKERWNTIPAAPVVVLPFESDETVSRDPNKKTDKQGKPETT